MTCRELKQLLVDWIADELSAYQYARLERHLGSCPNCMRYAEGYEQIVALARNLPPLPLPEDVCHRLRLALARLYPQETPS
jgi:anti-sigma factor RsiW